MQHHTEVAKGRPRSRKGSRTAPRFGGGWSPHFFTLTSEMRTDSSRLYSPSWGTLGMTGGYRPAHPHPLIVLRTKD